MVEPTRLVCLACGDDIDEDDAIDVGGVVGHFWCFAHEDESGHRETDYEQA